jgi:hypothetical protein
MKKRIIFICLLFITVFLFSATYKYTHTIKEGGKAIKAPIYEKEFKPSDLVKSVPVAKLFVYSPNAFIGIDKPDNLLAIIHVEATDEKYFDLQNIDFSIYFNDFVTVGTLKEEYKTYQRKDGIYNAYSIDWYSGDKYSLNILTTRTDEFCYLCSEVIDTTKAYGVGFNFNLSGYNVNSEKVSVDFNNEIKKFQSRKIKKH